MESLSAKSALLACLHASIPALCSIHVRKGRAQWSPAAEFYSFSILLSLTALSVSCLFPVFLIFLVDFPWHLVLQTALFSKDGPVGFQERKWYPELFRTCGAIRHCRCITSSAVSSCTGCPTNEKATGALQSLKIWQDPLVFWNFMLRSSPFLFLSILSIYYCKCQLSQKLFEMEIVAIGSTETGFGLKFLGVDPSISPVAWRPEKWQMRREQRCRIPVELEPQGKTWRSFNGIERYLKYS